MRLTSKQKEELKDKMVEELVGGLEGEDLEENKQMLNSQSYEEIREMHNEFFDINLGTYSTRTAIDIEECQAWFI